MENPRLVESVLKLVALRAAGELEHRQNQEVTEHLASFPQLNPNPIIEVDMSGEVIFVNQVTHTILENLGMNGREVEAFLPEDLGEILKDLNRQSESTLFREVIVSDHIFGETIQLIPQFKVARIYAREITKRKHAEEKIQESEERFRTLANAIPQLAWIAKSDGYIFWYNQRWYDYTGTTPEEMEGWGWQRVHDPEVLPQVLEKWKDTIVTGLPFDMIFPLRGADGEFRLFLTRVMPLKDASGQVIQWFGTNTDITDSKLAEEALREARDELEVRVQERTIQLQEAYETLQNEVDQHKKTEEQLRQSQKMEAIGTLAGGIAHDFNNMLAGILGFTEMAIEDVPDRPDVQRSLQNVLKSAMRAKDLVKKILVFSRKTNDERALLSLSPLVKETVQFLRASIPSTIEISLDIATSWDHVLAAPVEVHQILMNLATNASLAMQEKGGVLEVSLSDIDFTPESPVLGLDVMQGEYIQLTVKDTGVGMTPDVTKRVFEPFFTTREVGKGTGMGLAVVYGIVKDLQGTITVESAPGIGSTFRVFFPKVQAEAQKEETDTIQVPKGTERILFIDDEEMLIKWGQVVLERLGYTVTAVNNSKEAFNILSSDPSRFDLVITDHTMPGMTGVEIARELLRIRLDLPIILCTGHNDAVSPEIAMEAGIRQLLMKPVAKPELAQAIRRALDDNQDSH